MRFHTKVVQWIPWALHASTQIPPLHTSSTVLDFYIHVLRSLRTDNVEGSQASVSITRYIYNAAGTYYDSTAQSGLVAIPRPGVVVYGTVVLAPSLRCRGFIAAARPGRIQRLMPPSMSLSSVRSRLP